MLSPVQQRFDRHSLDIDATSETARIVAFLRQHVSGTLRKRGLVVGVSGGVDSAVVLALAVRALTPQKVLALLLPEQDSDPTSEQLARSYTSRLGVETIREDITASLRGFDCYRRRDEAIRRLIPSYDSALGFRSKITLPSDLLETGTLNLFQLVVITPEGKQLSMSLPPKEFLEIVAASNFKQRARMSFLYYHAECRNFAVAGTPNRNEHQQGFFVKHGDGGADINPIVHLYKTQVYQLAKYLDVPNEIYERTPTTDTYSAPCSQQEFFFRLPFAHMDLIGLAHNRGISADDAAAAIGLPAAQVQRAFRDMAQKHQATEYLRTPALALSTLEEGAP